MFNETYVLLFQLIYLILINFIISTTDKIKCIVLYMCV